MERTAKRRIRLTIDIETSRPLEEFGDLRFMEFARPAMPLGRAYQDTEAESWFAETHFMGTIVDHSASEASPSTT